MTSHHTSLPIAVQLYSLRELPGGCEATLAQVAAAGYTAVEALGDHGYGAEDLRAILDKHGLRVISTHLPLQALRDNLDGIIAFNQAIGNDTLVAPYIPELRSSPSVELYQETGRVLGELARRAKAAGARLLYHNHDWEMAELDGKLALDWLFEAAGPELGFEPDLAWIAAADRDPVELLERYAGRCPRIHVKDLAAKSAGEVALADVGYGTLDWARLLPAARAAGAEWYIVEHDNPPDPIASVSRSLAYLREHLPAALAD